MVATAASAEAVKSNIKGLTLNYQRKPVDPESFLQFFEKIAENFRWFYVEGRKIRTRIEGVTVCPMQAVGYHKARDKDKEIPDTRNMGAACGYDDRVAALIVHNADEIVTSRYYSQDVRFRLLKAAKLVDVVPPLEEE